VAPKRQSTFNLTELKEPQEVPKESGFELDDPRTERDHPAEKTYPFDGFSFNPKGSVAKDSRTGDMEYNGLPFKGTSYPMKDKDPEHMKPQLDGSVQVRILNTWVPEELAEYQKISQGVLEGRTKISYEEKLPMPEMGGWRIMIRYWDQFYRPPKHLDVHRGALT